jgi:hypothetical protein
MTDVVLRAYSGQIIKCLGAGGEGVGRVERSRDTALQVLRYT